ncbi:MAG: hypothetical protein K5657_08565 [Desulfovibrio sp.]|nr:hypothetical protein [Desulfovibrio sp.]
MSRLSLILLFLCAVILGSTEAMAAKYYVYCANGKVEVDMRDPKQMKSARGPNTYVMSEFAYKSDADKFAKQLGGTCPKK